MTPLPPQTDDWKIYIPIPASNNTAVAAQKTNQTKRVQKYTRNKTDPNQLYRNLSGSGPNARTHIHSLALLYVTHSAGHTNIHTSVQTHGAKCSSYSIACSVGPSTLSPKLALLNHLVLKYPNRERERESERRRRRNSRKPLTSSGQSAPAPVSGHDVYNDCLRNVTQP